MKLWIATTCVVLACTATGLAAAKSGPVIDWDPAYAWQIGATPTNLPSGGEFKMVGIVSMFGPPLDFLHADDPTKEYTFYVHGLISGGTVAQGPPSLTLYTTNYSGGTIEVYQDLSPDASFDPNPPNAGVPGDFIDGGPPILTGSFAGFVVQSNNFTQFDTGNIEGNINWTGGTLYDQLTQNGGQPCPGLFTGGSTWNPPLLPAGYLFLHDGKIDLQCPTPARTSTWGKIKTLYR